MIEDNQYGHKNRLQSSIHTTQIRNIVKNSIDFAVVFTPVQGHFESYCILPIVLVWKYSIGLAPQKESLFNLFVGAWNTQLDIIKIDDEAFYHHDVVSARYWVEWEPERLRILIDTVFTGELVLLEHFWVP